jgi:hypothetical protein
VHAWEEVQDTPLKLSSEFADEAIGTLGVDWTFHTDPFQTSASAVGTPPAVLVLAFPTAMQYEAELHDTPTNCPTTAGVI